jgi:hypothetical protein
MNDTGTGEKAEEVIPYCDIPPAFISFVQLAQRNYQRRSTLAGALAGRSKHNWINCRGETLSYHVAVGEVRQMDLALQQQNLTLAIADLPYGFNVEGSENDNAPFHFQDVVNMVESFVKVTTSPVWQFTVLHSAQQTIHVMAGLDQVCNAGIDGGIWEKPNINVRHPGNRMVWGFKSWSIGFHLTVHSGRNGMYTFGAEESKSNIIKEIPCVINKVLDSLGAIINPYQKPVALSSWFVNHFRKEGDWVADLCCGMGGALVAALLANRNGAALDKSKRQVEFVKQRIITLDPQFVIKEESNEYREGIQGLEVQPLSKDGSAMVIPTFVLLHDKVIINEVATKAQENKDEEEDGDEDDEEEE